MNLKEARQILIENRPDRPQSTKNRLLQSAIDVAVDVLEDAIEQDEKRN